MKRLIILMAALTIPGAAAFTPLIHQQPRATFLGSRDVAKVMEELSPTAAIDQPMCTVDGGTANVGVFVVYRPEEADQGCTIEHDTLANDKATSIFFVLNGAGTLITEGKLKDPTRISSGDPDLRLLGSGSRGSGIKGGESRRIAKGDIVIIPPGVPHGFSAIEKSIAYEVVRVDGAKILPLK
jgi:Cupin